LGQLTVIPVGPPQTGLGGASLAHNDDLLVVGLFVLLGAAGSLIMAIRRRANRSAVANIERP
jgi:hypothetical protein